MAQAYWLAVDYTTGLATKDKTKQDKAVNDLVGYTQDLGAFLSSANLNLPKNVVADLVQGHILSLKTVIDAPPAISRRCIRSCVPPWAICRCLVIRWRAAIAKQFPNRFASL